ncbi:MAG: 50S ribosomal protein L9 [Spirochaetales bacterium]|nr:50S ribosomal protein L9 [Spirochaetales bacterium]
MKIILNQDVYNLGEEGDICVVTNGYARNFLIPQKMALIFNKQNSAVFESRKAAIEKRKEEKRLASAGLKEKIEAVSLELKVSSGDTGKLFGSVTNAKIAEELKKAGVIVERKKIELPGHTIKMVGEFVAKVKLYGNETADLKIVVISDKKIEKPVEPAKSAKAEKVEENVVESEEAVETETVESVETEAEESVETEAEESTEEV